MTLPSIFSGFYSPHMFVTVGSTIDPIICRYKVKINKDIFLPLFQRPKMKNFANKGFSFHLWDDSELIVSESITLFRKDNIAYFLDYEFFAKDLMRITKAEIEFEGVPVISFSFQYGFEGKYFLSPAVVLREGESLSMNKISFRV